MMNQQNTPLYDALLEKKEENPISFHVPGHKNGTVFLERAQSAFQSLLSIDATEIAGLDDLHAPDGVIAEAQELASEFFKSKGTFFLVNGSTVGNLAMILTVCGHGDEIIVQRNCHKSVLNGIELAGATPVFISPIFEKETGRYSKITVESVEKALHEFPNAKAILLTYPDYFGRTYPLNRIAEVVHKHGIPLLVDEAHGVHFHLGDPFPSPALAQGADVVVQSAHKMAPGMTMSAFLHTSSHRINHQKIKHYLQMLQSSSPSYPLLASLDLARAFLAQWKERDQVLMFIEEVRTAFKHSSFYEVKPLGVWDDPLKLTLDVKVGTGFDVAEALEEFSVYPELATSSQVLLTVGLLPSVDLSLLRERLSQTDLRLKNRPKRATIREVHQPFPDIQRLEMSFQEMEQTPVVKVNWHRAIGHIAAESVIPYPPGIALLMKGERISKEHMEHVQLLQTQGARFQNDSIEEGIRVFKGEW